jgi:HlyD family secretion protein
MKLEMAKAQVASLNAKRKEVSHSARIEQIDQAKEAIRSGCWC